MQWGQFERVYVLEVENEKRGRDSNMGVSWSVVPGSETRLLIRRMNSSRLDELIPSFSNLFGREVREGTEVSMRKRKYHSQQ